jgi:hypothetical protein
VLEKSLLAMGGFGLADYAREGIGRVAHTEHLLAGSRVGTAKYYAVRLKACIGKNEFPRWFGSVTLRRTIGQEYSHAVGRERV